MFKTGNAALHFHTDN